MKKLLTDRKILRKIHDRYYKAFEEFDMEDTEAERETKIYVPIDIKTIASDLDVDPDIVFGRLYYHLEKKYGYDQQGGAKVHIFALKVGKDLHAVNFPLLSAVLAELEESQIRFSVPVVLSALALVVSFISLFLSFMK